MHKSVAAIHAVRSLTRFVGPSARHREQRLGLHRSTLTRSLRSAAGSPTSALRGGSRLRPAPARRTPLGIAALRRTPQMTWSRSAERLSGRVTPGVPSAWRA
jgi:hypothetical protein